MPILYRVDRADTCHTPVGMNSILYTSDSFSKAVEMFRAHKPGFNEWDQPDDSYGVLLSVWDGQAQSYRIIRQKWINDTPAA